MSEPIEWIYQAGTGCAYCKDGLCQRMNQLMEEGYSQRQAAKVMEEEAAGKWKADTIKRMFQRFMGTFVPTKPKQTLSQEEQFRKKYNAFLKEVIKAKRSGWQEVSYSLACELIGDLNNYI
ncbi:MAG: hypothetical protein R6V39_05305 [Desulfovibrionales bacterium]